MKVLRTFFVIICVGVMCCGCQKTPDEVKQRIETYGDNEQIMSEEIKYCTVDELKEIKIADITVKLDNMTLPDEVDFSNIDMIEELDMAFDDNYLESGKQFLEVFNINKSTLVDEGETFTGKTVTYDSEKEKKYFTIEDNGFMSFVSGITYELVNSDLQQSVEAKYDLDVDDISEENVQFESGNVKLHQIRTKAEDWLERYLPASDFEYEVSDIYVRNFKDGDDEYNQISLFAEIEYKGIPFNAYGIETGFDGTSGKVNLMTYGVNMNYEEEKLTYFSNGVGGLKINSSKKVDKIIDLESAVKIVNEEISGFNKLNISKIIPVYALYPQYKSSEEQFSYEGQKVEGRPVYAFIINEGEDDSVLGIYKSNSCKFIFVDMITGEITTNIG